MVAAIKMVDDANGNLFAPADWERSEPAIKNTKAGVLEYYQKKYNEEKQKEEAGKPEELLSKLKKILVSVLLLTMKMNQIVVIKKRSNLRRL